LLIDFEQFRSNTFFIEVEIFVKDNILNLLIDLGQFFLEQP
jgi:hypothetical protein